jgi:hypothetical protein
MPSDLSWDYYDFIICAVFSVSPSKRPDITSNQATTTSTPFPIHNSLIILPFDAIQPEILAASLNKQKINTGSDAQGRPGFNSRQGISFCVLYSVRQALEPTHPIQWVSAAVSPGVQRPGLDHFKLIIEGNDY